MRAQEENFDNAMAPARRQDGLHKKVDIWKADLAGKEKTRLGLAKLWDGACGSGLGVD